MKEKQPIFEPAAYTSLRQGHGAAKLSQSAIAPLVAAARGYETVFPDEVKDVGENVLRTPANSKIARQLKSAVGRDDALIMPWYRMDETVVALRNNEDPPVSTYQLRPAVPLPREDGKPLKYVNLTGSDAVLGIHPATPDSWLNQAPTVLFAEGMLKGDSALSAILRANGLSEEELLLDEGISNIADNSRRARAKLTKLMEGVPEEDRVLVVSFFGIYNWEGREEWLSFKFKDRVGLVAFDGDISSNRHVWNQGEKLLKYMERRKMQAYLLDLNLLVEDAGVRRMGIDDVLAEGYSWHDVLETKSTLPSAPARDGYEPGFWKVSEDGARVSSWDATYSPEGQGATGYDWIPRVEVGGRIKSIFKFRSPTTSELKTGKISHAEDPSIEAEVEIALRWTDATTGSIRTGTVVGPATILSAPPSEWDRHHASIPSDLRTQPDWPPRGADGEKWLRAIKEHRREETITSIRWDTMGWVPTEDGTPKFVVGYQEVTPDGITKVDLPGVHDGILNGADDFGVIEPDKGVDWREQAKQDLEEVVRLYTTSGAINDLAIAATVLAAGLRPCLPVSPGMSIYFTGTKGSGKSFMASHAMGFWQPRAGIWSEKYLTGSASDTGNSMEHAIARSVIWTVDDHAPSTDRRRADNVEASLSDVMRSVFNGKFKRRMRQDGTSRHTDTPKALLLVTGENELTVTSVLERAILVNIRPGVLSEESGPTDLLRKMRDETGVSARLSGAFLRWIASQPEKHPDEYPNGWESMVDDYHKLILPEQTRLAKKIITGRVDAAKVERQAKIAAVMMSTFVYLEEMARDLKCDPEVITLLGDNHLRKGVAMQVSATHKQTKGLSPGRNLINAISTMLSMGQAHIANADSPDLPPAHDMGEATGIFNAKLGWTIRQSGETALSPQGPMIGWIRKVPGSSGNPARDAIILDHKAAFSHAQRHHPSLVQHGMKPAQTWQSVWDEGLAVPEDEGWKRGGDGRSHYKTSWVRVMVNGTSIHGVPIYLDTLLDQRMED